jgi:hypothetical protein
VDFRRLLWQFFYCYVLMQSMPLHDLRLPEYFPPECPVWLIEQLPTWLEPFRGINGLPDVWRAKFREANALNVRGVDRFQANQFIVYRKETADYLYDSYTPPQTHYSPGLYPSLENAARSLVGESVGQTVSAILYYIEQRILHPEIPPSRYAVSADRNLSEEEILASGRGWCNEQARVFVRLCQIVGIPARLVHLFYSSLSGGHTVVEYLDPNGWCMADATYACDYRQQDGRPISAALCHGDAQCNARYGVILDQKVSTLLKVAQEVADPDAGQRLVRWMEIHGNTSPQFQASRLHTFALINYPFPGRTEASNTLGMV